MKHFNSKLLLWVGLFASCLFTASASAQGNGHHQSGLAGQVSGLPTFVHQCNVRIVSSDGGKFDEDITTDSELRFEVSLKPGTYTLVPYVPHVAGDPLFIAPGSPVVVQVAKKEVKALPLVYMSQPQ